MCAPPPLLGRGVGPLPPDGRPVAGGALLQERGRSILEKIGTKVRERERERAYEHEIERSA